MGRSLPYSAAMYSDAISPMTEPLTLALADDDELHTELVSAWLEHHGYRVVSFASGDELLQWAAGAERHVDAFVLDVDMPGRDGIQSHRELRALDSYAQVPAVFVTSTAQRVEEETVHSTPGGTLKFIRKDGQMLVRLHEWLSEHVYTES